MAQSNFATRMLEKQGWKEGDGLGKNRDGISKPIKAFMKRDKAGVGQDLGADLTDHWWLRVFNDAAKSNITTSEVTKVKENALPQNRLYSCFRKGSTLTQGKEEQDYGSSSEDERESRNLNSADVPTLDDIHKYCGGATGHRAATLGIKMTGKLKRAAEHERLFNEKLKCKAEANDGDELNTSSSTAVKKKKKKKKDTEKPDNAEPKMSKDTKGDEYLNCCDKADSRNVMCEEVQEESSKRKKNKKKKRKREVNEDEQSELLEDTGAIKKRKKSKSDDANLIHSAHEETNELIDLENDEKHKRKKKKKRKD